MDTDSELVEFEEDNKLQSPTDSVYSVMGIIYKMQAVADRTVLLGELRSDLTTTTAYASADLKAITNFQIDTDNAYNLFTLTHYLGSDPDCGVSGSTLLQGIDCGLQAIAPSFAFGVKINL